MFTHTHTCGEFGGSHVGQAVALNGWVTIDGPSLAWRCVRVQVSADGGGHAPKRTTPASRAETDREDAETPRAPSHTSL